jgi:hypothetical protein
MDGIFRLSYRTLVDAGVMGREMADEMTRRFVTRGQASICCVSGS